MSKYIAMLEDDSDDRYLTSETVVELNLPIPIKFFSRSNELFEFVLSNKKPCLFLIDYNSVPDNAVDILKQLKADDELKEIPVVVLSDNELPTYRNECYALGASSFIKKPGSMKETKEKIQTFFKYWFEVAEV